MNSRRLDLLVAYSRQTAPIDPGVLADAVSQMCVEEDGALTQSEAALVFDILERIYPEVELTAKQRLAERVATRTDLPRPLAVLIANDTIEVARPVLVACTTLTDDDIIRVIVERGRAHRLAVTERPNLPSHVCDVLITLGDEDVYLKLVRNTGAVLSDQGLQRLLIASRNMVSLQEPLINRPEMGPDMAALMVHWVSDALRARIAELFGEEVSTRVSADVLQSAEEAVQDVSSQALDSAFPASIRAFLAALRVHDRRAMEMEMGLLTRLPAFAVSRILFSIDGGALAVVCRSAGVRRKLFAEIYSRLHDVAPYGTRDLDHERAAAIEYFDRLTSQQADTILDGWRTSPQSVWGDMAGLRHGNDN